MKTTFDLSPVLVRQLRREVARRGLTMSALVETALQGLFQRQTKPKKKFRSLPTLNSGGYLVDIADRNALYEVFDQDSLFTNPK